MSEKIRQLHDELAQLRASGDAYQQQLTRLTERVNRLEQHFAMSMTNLQTNAAPVPLAGSESMMPAQDAAQTTSVAAAAKPSTATAQVAARPPQRSVAPVSTTTQQSSARRPTKKPPTSVWFDQLLSQAAGQLFAPLAQLTEQLRQFYHSYQQRGMGQVFLLTLAGVITLTLGFAYLLQYSYHHLLSDLGKVGLSFLLANGITLIGIAIVIRRPRQTEYGSALVGLGIVLNYLVSYVSGSYYQITSIPVTLSLMVIISMAGFALAHRLNTRVVAVIALVGGSLSPLLMGSGQLSLTLYLPYLLLLGLLALAVSRKQQWPPLMICAALLHISTLEYLVFEQSMTASVWVLLTTHLLIYLYALYALWLLRPRHPQKAVLGLIASLSAFFILFIYQLTPLAGYVLAANGLFWLALYGALIQLDQCAQHPLWRSLTVSPMLRQSCLIFSASLFGFAALILIDTQLLGLIWCLEGVLMLWIGLHQSYRHIRFEAYLLLLIGLGSTLYRSALAIINMLGDNHSATLFAASQTMLVTVIFGFIARQLLIKHQSRLGAFEQKIPQITAEIVALLQVAVLYLLGQQLLGKFAVNLAPVATALLLWHSWKYKLKLAEIVAWLQLLPLIIVALISIVINHSLHFSDQWLVAKLAQLQLFAAMWLMSEFYQRVDQGSRWRPLAATLRIGFYLLLPLVWLPKVMRHWPELLPLALSAATAIALTLSHWVKHKLLAMESMVLSYLGLLVIAAACLAKNPYGLGGLLVATLFYGALIYYQFARNKQQHTVRKNYLPMALQHSFQQRYYVFALGVAVTINAATASWHLTFAALSLYFWALLLWRPRPAALRGSLQLNDLLATLLALLTVLLHQLSFPEILSAHSHSAVDLPLLPPLPWLLPTLADIAVLLITARALQKKRGYQRMGLSISRYPQQIWGWHLLFAWSYLLWSFQLPLHIAQPLSSILLVCHGCTLMFISLRPDLSGIIRLATLFFAIACGKMVLLDMTEFSLPQKVIAFMFVGAILLAVAYRYMQLKNNAAPALSLDADS